MTGFLYAMQSGEEGPYKIGWSENPGRRLEQLQGGHYDVLRLVATGPGSKFDESRIHSSLAEHRLRGEWFANTPEVRAAINDLIVLAPTNARFTRRNGPIPAKLLRHVIPTLGDALWEMESCSDEDSAAEIWGRAGRKVFRLLRKVEESAA